GDGDEFRISGPTAVAIVRGTDFELSVPEPGVTQIAVYRGRVLVEPRLMEDATTERFELGPGEGAVIREYGVTRVGLPGEPRPVQPDDGAVLVFSAGAKRGVRFDWEAPADATRASFQLAADPACTRLYDERELTVGDGLRMELAPGEYYWRVAAVDDNGLRGPFGPVRTFSVIIDDTPPELELRGWRLGGGGRTLTVWGETVDAINLVVGTGPVPLSGDGAFEVTVPTGAYGGSLTLVVCDEAGNSKEYRLVFRVPDLPVGLVGPTGGTGLNALVSAQSLDPWSLRLALGADYYDWLLGTHQPGQNPLERAAQPWIALSLGLGGWGEFALKAPYVNQIFSDGETFAGMGDLMLAGKLSPPQTSDFTYALYTRVALPTGQTHPEEEV
ncbi:hypothetical protein KAU45_06040, partial [bacterium]|nr:hypothetical protein [bacterium]